jgi:ketoreductase RED2
MIDLIDKVAIVTGSSSGIGKCIAQALSEAGAKIIINSATSVAEGQKIAAELPSAFYVQANVADENQCKDLINATLKKWGKIDILVNNAAAKSIDRIPHQDLDAATDETFHRMFNTNVMSAWYLSRAALPHLKANGLGHIINISSIAGLRATGSSIPYAVSKAALNHLTVLLANSFGPEVRVNAIAPGYTLTPRTEHWQEAQAAYTNKSALKRSAKPEEIAAAVLGIIHTNHITGQIIAVDGGYMLG